MDDLTNLTDLNETDILDVLLKRYQQDAIYTSIGDIIIAANPYKTLSIYGEDTKQEYKNLKGREKHKPHIYIISDRAYQNLKWNGLNQCCVVSGESGAGKTESTKLLIEHIAYLCKHDNSNLNEKIIEVNPLLEAFGNAQTVINNNSSRFGKFIELIFDRTGQLEGATMSEYLLEKSRLVFHAPGERNFHIFYYFFAGVDPGKLKANRLKEPEKHRIMAEQNGEAVYKNNEKIKECKNTWIKIINVMSHVGFNKEEIECIEALLTAIIHIADTIFIPHPETEGVSIKDDEAVALCAQLLGVDAEKLVDSLIIFKNKAGNEEIIILKNESQANDGRDALAKALYGRLFIWIVNRINQLLAPKNNNNNQSKIKDNTWIGILDIYGFENFKSNSFEQLCINIANEQLQLFFNKHIFQMELMEYEKEGIAGNNVTFVDNQPLLDLFFGSKDNPGLLAILDEESKFPQASDQTFINKMVFNLSKKPEFQTNKGQTKFFTICHFAGPVTYNVEGFLEKNRDTLSENVRECLGASCSLLVYELFSPLSDIHINLESTRTKKMKRVSMMMNNFESQRINSTNRMKRASIISSNKIQGASNANTLSNQRMAKTLASHFTSSLQELIQKMVIAEPHFIRCIKPNSNKAPNDFNGAMVLEQLKYTGVLETVRIRKQGYSTRLLFDEFIHRYGLIVTTSSDLQKSSETCKKILLSSKLADWQMGKSKVFLKHYHVDMLNSVLSSITDSILTCQKLWRATMARRKLTALKAQALVYTKAFEAFNSAMEDYGQRFYEELQLSSKDDLKKPVAVIEDIQESEYMMTPAVKRTDYKTVRVKDKNVPNQVRESVQPRLPQIWNPVLDAPQSDPCYVFLKESLPKINMLQRDIWCKLYLMELNAIIGKLYIRDSTVVLNDSPESYTGKVIGIRSKDFDHLKIPQCQEIISQIGKGITITKDNEGNIFVTRMSDLEVHVFGDEKMSVAKTQTKVFDIEKFKVKVMNQLKSKEAKAGLIDVCQLAKLSVFNFSLGGGVSVKEVELPLWISIINIHALDLFGDDDVLQEFARKGLSSSDLIKIKEVWSQLNFMRK